MKAKNAIKRIEAQLGQVKLIRQNKVCKFYQIIHNGYELTFTENLDGDAENFYVVKVGLDNGFNGYNGIFPTNLISAIVKLKWEH